MQPRASLLLLVSSIVVLSVLQPVLAALPVIYFHGVLSNSAGGHNFAANLTAEGRLFVPLSFCDDACTLQGLNTQVQLAIAQIRGIVSNDSRFDDGYVFMAHSQGSPIARAVIEEMDDHKVTTFISMAGVANGVFHGPQPADQNAVRAFISGFASAVVPTSVFDASKFSIADLNGTFQYAIDVFARDHPEAQAYAHFNHARSPVKVPWITTNTFLPVINNLNPCLGNKKCLSDQQRRRANFLKLKAAHFFASSSDGIVTPWESSILGQYSELESVEELKTSEFSAMRIVDMKDTVEYQEDTYGLKTLDAKGGLFRYAVDGIPHSCWTDDGSPGCSFKEIYDQHVYPVLAASITAYKQTQ
ncbi:Lysosomal thioesterase ppt2 [Globisporangium polare]